MTNAELIEAARDYADYSNTLINADTELVAILTGIAAALEQAEQDLDHERGYASAKQAEVVAVRAGCERQYARAERAEQRLSALEAALDEAIAWIHDDVVDDDYPLLARLRAAREGR